MIITIKGSTADLFKDSNIGTLSTWTISRVLGDGATYSGDTFVDKNAALNATVTIAEGYELNGSVTVTMGGNPVTEGITVDGNTITIAIGSVTGNVVVKVPTVKILTEEPEPETPTTHTFTINPDPTSATVTLSATGYSTVSGTGSKSITVANGTEVNWSVSASGYTTRTGNWTISGGNKTENITLTAISGGGGSALDLSTLSLAHCSSSKIGTSNKENLTYDQTTHELKVNNTGWYKVSYFTTPIQVGTEIEYTAHYSNKINGNFVGIYTQEDLVDNVAEVNGSFWPAPSGFGMYAPGTYTETSPDYVVIWDKSNKKIKTSDLKMADFLNGKTVKLKMLETGVEAYVDGEKITWGTGSNLAALTSGTNYYLGFHNSGSANSVAQTINYIGPIR